MKNYWNDFEYSKYKLLLHPEKICSIMGVLNGNKEFDEVFPISVELHLTNHCNLNCEWCTDRILRGQQGEMKTETICKLLAELASHGTGITLEGGGEPTLHPDFRKIVYTGRTYGASMGLITNGVVDISDVIKYFRWVRVSLDATTAEEYIKEKKVNRFDDVIKNLKNFSQMRDTACTQIGVGFVLTNRNHHMFPELIRRLDSIGVDYIYVRPVEECEDLKPSIDDLYSIRNMLEEMASSLRIKCMIRISERMISANAGLPCVANSLTSIIHANGDVVMCEKRRLDLKVFGNLKNDNFSKIWFSDIRKTASKCVMQANMQEECQVCRMTEYNQLFCQLTDVRSTEFI